MNRNRLARDFFARGDPEPIVIEQRTRYTAELYDLLTAYAAQRQKRLAQHVTIRRREVWSLAEAREVLLRLTGGLADWTTLDTYLMEYLPPPRTSPEKRNTVRASSFAAALELVREGKLAMRQESAYAPLYLRRSPGEDANGARNA